MSTFSIGNINPATDEYSPEIRRLPIDPGGAAPNQLGSTVRIEGEIYGLEDMLVDGEVAGSMALPEHTLTVGAKARVKANIKAKKLVLIGSVEGNIEAGERVELRSCCSVLGDVRSPRIIVENGAYIKGTIEVLGQHQEYSPSPKHGATDRTTSNGLTSAAL